MGVTFESEQSAFNMALAYLERINRLLYNAAEHKTKRELKSWFDTMRTVFGEVKIKFKDEEIEEIQDIDEEIVDFFLSNPGINRGDLNRYFVRGREIVSLNYPTKREELFKLIDKFEFKIKGYADKYGLLLPNRADPRFAILER